MRVRACIFFRRIKDSTSKRSDGEKTAIDEDSIKFYSGNPDVMKPKRAVSTLLQKDLPSSPKICTIQPLEVYHHATFHVDLQALPSAQDIKCDNVGNWRNNSNDKFYFTLEAMDKNSTRVIDVATLRREYYMLKHDNDFRKRIDFLSSEWITLCGLTIVVNI